MPADAGPPRAHREVDGRRRVGRKRDVYVGLLGWASERARVRGRVAATAADVAPRGARAWVSAARRGVAKGGGGCLRAACRFLPAAGVWQAIPCCARSRTTARGCVPQLQDERSSDSVAWLPSGRGTGPQSSESGRSGAMWRLARSSEPCSEMACPGLVAARCRGWKARMSSTGLERRGLYRGTTTTPITGSRIVSKSWRRAEGGLVW